MKTIHAGRLAVLATALGLVGGCNPGPKELILTSAESQRDLTNALLVREMIGRYEAPDPSRQLMWDQAWAKWRKDRLKYGWPYERRKHVIMGPTVVNPDVVNYIPPEKAPMRIHLNMVSTGWRISIDEPLAPGNDDPRFFAVSSFLFKPGFVPRRIGEKEWGILADGKGIVRIGMRPLMIATEISDTQTLNVIADALPLLSHPQTRGPLRERFREWMADPLRKIAAVPAGPEPYLGFDEARAKAKELLGHLE